MSEFIKKIILVILIFFLAVAVYLTVFSKSKVSSATSDMYSLVHQVHRTYSLQRSFRSLNNNVLVHLAPSSIVENNSITNPWGGAVTGGVEPTNATQFFILSTHVPNDACSKFALRVDAIKVQINGGTIYTKDNKIDAKQAVRECRSSNKSNTIRFVFGHSPYALF